MTLENKVMLVTGGGRAIGRRTALLAAERGADVALLSPDQADLERVAGEVRKLGRRAIVLVGDVSDEQQVQSSVERTLAELGQIDILVNNAGIIGPTAPVPDVKREEWDEVMAVNLTGAFLCAKHVLPGMIARKQGRIINLSSIAGKLGYPLRSPYSVSKWGIIGLTLTLAKETGEHGIQVNAVCPGPVEGERMRTIIETRAVETGQTVEQVRGEFYVNRAALGRMVNEIDIAEMICYLASPAGDNITGQALEVSAGFNL